LHTKWTISKHFVAVEDVMGSRANSSSEINSKMPLRQLCLDSPRKPSIVNDRLEVLKLESEQVISDKIKSRMASFIVSVSLPHDVSVEVFDNKPIEKAVAKRMPSASSLPQRECTL